MIGFVILFSLLVIVGLMVGTVLFVRYYFNRTIGRKHKELEWIVDRREVPEEWLIRVGKGKAAAPVIQRRLAKLEQYVHRTRLVDSEETRLILLDGLAAIREEWMNRDGKFAGNGEKDALHL